MKTSTASAVLPCTPDTFWASFFDESYLRALYLDEFESRHTVGQRLHIQTSHSDSTRDASPENVDCAVERCLAFGVVARLGDCLLVPEYTRTGLG